MRIEFDKYSAHGNDFIIIDNRNLKISSGNHEGFRRLCRRRVSVGADGIILIGGGTPPDVKLEFFNADGYIATMCGNATRASADYAHRTGIMNEEGTFVIGGRRHGARIENDGTVSVEIHLESAEIQRHKFSIDSRTVEGISCNTGVEHLLIFDDKLYENAPLEQARELRHSPEFAPGGTNVSFVRIGNPGDVFIKTFEKGVEDFTLSCGTAATAAGHICATLKGCELPLLVHADGGALKVAPCDPGKSYWIGGRVKRVYSGVIDDIELTVNRE